MDQRDQRLVSKIIPKQPQQEILAPSLSQATGKPLSDPMIHEYHNCFFNQQEQNKQNECPVCGQQGSFQFLPVLKEAQAQCQKMQIVLEGKQAYYVKRNIFDESIYSEDQSIREKQLKLKYQRLQDNKNTIKNLLSLYNQEMIEILFRSGEEYQNYTILAFLNGQLILFYHQYRMKIALDVYLKVKVVSQSILQINGQVIQIIEFQKKIYLLHKLEEKIQLYQGDLSQVATSNPMSAKITFISIPNFTLQSWAVIVKYSETKLILVGKEGVMTIYDKDPKEHYLTRFNKSLPIIHQNSLISNTTTELVISNNSCVYTLKLSRLVETTLKQYQTTFNSEPTILLKINDNSFIAFDHSKLTSKNLFYIELPNENNPHPNSASVNNHSNFAKLEKAVSTTYISGDISCIIIGMRVNNFIVPAILVFNQRTKTFEIEIM